ncbi:integral membrane protein [Colletotrichum fioriniae PJ7]|uniref:Integral membrane protein n=1 Tax=Colletotrichum fioriniae PJ7 TaxID=1445577 RepID=A0A010R530_9PEZI|nr:integral membrane protein [Colletotrichum fioriniae PJ7]
MSNATALAGAFPPPPGVTPNFENPRDAGWMWNVVGMSVLAAITTLFFGIRTYVKFSMATPFLPDDWTCAVSYALIMIYVSTVFVMAHYGEGYHAWELTKESYQEVMRWLYASSIIYCPAAYFTKVTLLLLESRVFAVHERVSRGIKVFIVTLLICYIPIQILKTVICLPISAFWNPKTPNPRCLNQRKIFIADLSLAIITDFFILVLPVPLLWGLRMPLRKKLKVAALLGAGGIATAVTVYRMYLVVQFLTSTDVTADFVVLDLITALELVIGVVCACLPSTNLLYERIRRGERNQMGNLPRTAGDLKKGSSSSSSYWRRPANFDTELAVLTGQPMGMRPLTEESARKSEQIVEDWVYNPRANSMDGRREGWLAQGGESSALGCSRDRVPNWQNHEMEARKSWEAVWEKAIPSEGLASIPEDGAPPRLQLATHPPPDREHLTK